MIRPAVPIVQFLPARPRLTVKGCCYAIAVALVLAIIATVFKAVTGHSIAGLLVLVMVLSGALSMVWEFATRERR